VTSILFIVFLPLAASILAGFSNKSFGAAFPKAVTTGALFIACALSWPVFIHYLGGGEKIVTPVLNFIQSGDMHVSWSLRVDALTAVMLVVVFATQLAPAGVVARRPLSSTAVYTNSGTVPPSAVPGWTRPRP